MRMLGLFGSLAVGAFPTAPSADALAGNLVRMSALGVETMLTSVDVSIRDDDVSAAMLNQQAKAYRRVLHACLVAIPGSWTFSPGWGSPPVFDAHYVRKPAYTAIRAELTE